VTTYHRSDLAREAVAKAAREHRVNPAAIIGHERNRRVQPARRYAAWLMRHLLGMSFAEIGYVLGQRDHTTVMYMLNVLKEQA